MAGADLSFALELAELADSLSLPRFRALDLRVDTKADLTPVTDADRAVERALRERIAAERPGDTVLGEEEGDEGGAVRWILDPIDGTRNFSRGIPVWATLIALERDGEIVCGVVSSPSLGRRWWAARGEGAYADGEQVHVSRVASLDEAVLSATYASDLEVLEPRAWHARGFGDFWQHVLVAEGAVDAALDAELAIWDYAAPALVVEEAGGRVTTLDGGALAPYKRIVSSNGLLHDEVLALLH
ncbi:MAG TPA: inositol monophosphatase family protein [Gaiellaceae bacterium]|nr:inositol monophosphatase family protein [Gaiellaceae bacterium]